MNRKRLFVSSSVLLASLATGGVLSLGCAVDASNPAPEATASDESSVTRAGTYTNPSWEVHIGGIDGFCSGTVLSERWVLTSAHCIDGLGDSLPNVTIGYASAAGVKTEIYNGRAQLIEKFEYQGANSGDVANDAAMLFLESKGLDLTKTGQGKLYAGTERPWMTGGNTSVYLAGWGDGSDLNGSADCAGLSNGVLRVGAGLNVNFPAAGGIMTVPIGAVTHACSGDSGGAWMLWRGGTYMQYALHHGRETGIHNAPLIESLIPFIKDTLKFDTPSHFMSVLTDRTMADGTKYQTVDHLSRGARELRGPGANKCMGATMASGNKVELRNCVAGALSQQWELKIAGEVRGGGLASTLCLDTNGWTFAGAAVRVATCTGADAQKFILSGAGQLSPTTNPGMCVVPQAPVSGVTNLSLMPCTTFPSVPASERWTPPS